MPRSGRIRVTVFGVAFALVSVLLFAQGDVNARSTYGRPFDVDKVLGKGTEKAGNGFWRIKTKDGKSYLTHGPDEAASTHGSSIGAGDPERAPVCAMDYYQHVLYARPAGTSDRLSTMKPEIQAIMRRINSVLNIESLESGDRTADYKVLCDSVGQIAVGSFVNSSSPSFTNVVNAAKAAGFNASNVDYTIFYDGTGPSGTCGVGTLYLDERLTADNHNQRYGGYGVSYSGCWNSTPMHENGHNQGAVQYNAPNSTGSGYHCRDENDVMCYSDGGDRDTGTYSRCTDRLHFDCGNDDYFDSSPEAGEYLASNWNLGSPLNRFIVFGSPGTTEPPPPPTPTWTRVEQNRTGVTYSGSWTTYSNSSASGGSYRRSGSKGSVAAFTFNGTGVRWIGVASTSGGIATVKIDGVVVATVDQYAPSASWKKVMFESTGLVAGSHKISITVTGTKNASSSNYRTFVDAFEKLA